MNNNSRFELRAWHKKEKTMLDPIEWHFGNPYCLWKFRDWEGFDFYIEKNGEEIEEIPEKDVILMQYVGLKDKNKRLIYEGDIIEWRGRERFQVIWENGGFQLVCLTEPMKGTREDLWYDWMEDAKNHQVIGNIYEHSHLLT